MGGNIRDSKCQETAMDRLKLLKQIFSYLTLLTGTFPLFAGGEIEKTGVARVVIAQLPGATETFRAQPEKVSRLFDRGLLAFTHKTDSRSAWSTLIGPDELVAIKVFSAPGPQSGTRPAVVEALVSSLLAAGHPSSNVLIWDRHLTDLRLAGFETLAKKLNVRISSAGKEGFDLEVFYENPIIGNLVWGDVEFGRKGEKVGRKSFATRLLTRSKVKIINVTPLLNHNYAGVTGNLLGLALGSVDNTLRFEGDPERLARALPELFAMPALGDQVVFNITDALLCQYQGEQQALLHYSAPLNQLWFSKDPVALDSLALQELDRQKQTNQAPIRKNIYEIYQNASLLELGVSEMKNIEIDFHMVAE